MQIHALYDELLQEIKGPSPAFDLVQLFIAAMGMPPAAFDENAEPTPAQERRLRDMIARHSAGEPLQYILGNWDFFDLTLAVGPGVLIPRPDTERLVEVGFELLGEQQEPVVADLMSGSGCIAATLALHRPKASVWAVELSPKALAWLRRNLSSLGFEAPRVNILEADALAPLPLPPCDLILSNPPYIPSDEIETLAPQVRAEPRMALDGGADGLDFLRRLPVHCLSMLRPGGWLAVEVGAGQADAVRGFFESAGYEDVRIWKDYGGIERCVSGQRGLL